MASFPFEYPKSRVWARAKVNGKDAFGILDTGADGTAIDSKFASGLGLVSTGVQTGSVEADEIEMGQSGPARFELGPVSLEAKGVFLVPLATGVPGLDFILGFDVMGGNPFTVDYRNKRIEFGLPAGKTVPFASDKEVRPSLTAEVLGESFVAILDTGSSGGLSMPLRWVEKNASKLKADLGEVTERKLLGEGKLRYHEFSIDSVTMGGVRFEVVPAEAVTAEKGSSSDQASNWASAGNRVMEKLGRIGIDGKGRRVVLEKQY